MATVSQKIKTTKKKVIWLLKHHPETKDDDKVLQTFFWGYELKRMNKGTITGISAVKFLELYKECKLTDADTITRARRKAQQNDPDLRGVTWHNRHKKAEPEVRTNINK